MKNSGKRTYYNRNSAESYKETEEKNKVAYHTGRGRHDDVLKFFQAAAEGPNIPGWMLDFHIGILNWYTRYGYLTRIQGAALDAAYALLGYQGIIHDPNYPEQDIG